MNKSVSVFVVLLSLTFLCVVDVQPVKAEAAIYIRADGTVEGTNKIQRDGKVYIFIEDVNIDIAGVDGIAVEKDNIVVDGAGYRLK